MHTEDEAGEHVDCIVFNITYTHWPSNIIFRKQTITWFLALKIKDKLHNHTSIKFINVNTK